MDNRHVMHRTAALFAVKHTFRLCRKANGYYFLVDNHGVNVDTPAWGGDTAAGAIRMMRRHLRLNILYTRACTPPAIQVRGVSVSQWRAVSA